MALISSVDFARGDPRDTGDSPPASVDAEQALLGSVLYDSAAFRLLRVELLPEHFYEPFHGRLWQSITETVRDGEVPEATFLAEEFRRDPAFLELGGRDYLADLIDHAPAADRASDFASHILDLFHKRRLMVLAEDICARVRSGADAALEIISELDVELGKIRGATTGPAALLTAHASAFATLREIDDEVAAGRPRGVQTGLRCFDHRLGGLPKTWLVTLGGRPSMGKTSLARAAMYGAAERNLHRTFAFFTLEMAHRELSERALSATTALWESRDPDIPQSRAIQTMVLSRSKVGHTEAPWLERAAARQPENLYILDNPILTLGDVERTVWALKAKGDLAAIAVDYLQLMKRADTRGRNDAALIGDITVGLKRLAIGAEICVLLVSQLSRGVDSREDKRPVLADLRESGSIEQDSNAVMFPYREAYYLQRTEPAKAHDREEWEIRLHAVRHLMEVNTAKLRQGEPGTDRQHYRPEFDLVTDWEGN